MTTIKQLLKIVVPAVLLVLLVVNIIQQLPNINIKWSDLNLGYLFFTMMILLVIFPQAAWCWYVILRSFKQKLSLKKALKIWLIANTSRYIPGSVWQYIGRVELSSEAGLPRSIATISLLLEVWLVLIAASLISSYALLLNFPIQNNLIGLLLLLPLVAIVPAVGNKAMLVLARLTGRQIDVTDLKFNWFQVSKALPLLMLNFLLNGLALFLLIKTLGIELPVQSLIPLTSFYALSWLLGYIAIFAPGGLGVSDVTLAFLLSSVISLPEASLVALLYRLLMTVAEVIIFMFAIRWKDE